MNNEPVAWMETYKGEPNNLDWDKNNLYCEGEFHNVVPLYTHPVKEQYKFGVDWSKDGNAVTVLKICEDGVAEVVFMDYQKATHPVKEQDESFDRTASHMAGEYVSWTSCVACGQRVTGDSIHTCSPQLKQLTDEEIIKVNEDIGTCWDVPHRFAIQIARAILLKAQEK